MRHISMLLIFLAISAAAVWPEEQPQNSLKILTIDVPFQGAQSTNPTAINDAGVITGSYLDAQNVYHGFVRTLRGNFISFDAPGAGKGEGQGTQAYSINLRGFITGGVFDANNVEHGFVRTPQGKIFNFDAPGASDTATYWRTNSNDINRSGTIAGWYLDQNGVLTAFLRAPDGSFTTFEAPGSGTDPWTGSQAVGVNAWGVASGNSNLDGVTIHGYVRTVGGQFIMFDCPDPTLTWANGVAINEEGVVTGYCNDPGFTSIHAFVRTPDSNIVLIDPPATGTEFVAGSFAFNINTFGAVPGWYWDQNYLNHGFVRTLDGNFVKFDVPGAGTMGGQGTIPWAINSAGQIVGTYVDSNGVTHGFLRQGWRPRSQ